MLNKWGMFSYYPFIYTADPTDITDRPPVIEGWVDILIVSML